MVIKWLNKCARLVWGILARRKVLFQNCSEYKTRVIDAFTVSLGPGTDDPTIKNVNLKKKIWPKKCARMPQIFGKSIFTKKNSKKKSMTSLLLKIWHKHPWSSSNHCTKFQNDRISNKRVIQKFAGEKKSLRKLFLTCFFLGCSWDWHG